MGQLSWSSLLRTILRNLQNPCFWSPSSWLLPLLTPKNSPLSTKNQLPSPNTAVYPIRPANTRTTSKPPTVSMSEEGEQKYFGDKEEESYGSVSRGSYSYELEGVTYTINWVADENGFQPTGAHLPVAPPMPEYVVKMLADLRAAGKLE